MAGIIYSNSWRTKPFTHGRPFVPLRQYDALRIKHEKLKAKVREARKNEQI